MERRYAMPTQDTASPYWLQGSAAAQTLARTLLERYPAAFHAEAAAVRPLKIGMNHDIRQALDVAPRVVSEVLRGYTRRRAYRAALAVPGALRVDLHGQPVAPVAPAHQQWAQQGGRRPPGDGVRGVVGARRETRPQDGARHTPGRSVRPTSSSDQAPHPSWRC